MSDDFETFTNGVATLGVPLDGKMLASFQAYERLLREWSARFNLLGPRALMELWSRHFLDALTLVAALPGLPTETRIHCIDVGSGAGIPGIPLKLAFPEWNLTLLEATTKKARFLEAALEELHLDGCEVLAARAEEVAHSPARREAYDLCVARAVTRSSALVELTLPFVAPLGYAVFYKGTTLLDEELEAAEPARTILGAGPPEVVRVPLPEHEGRRLVRYQKIAASPLELPRRSGIPEHQPLSWSDAPCLGSLSVDTTP